MAHHRPPFDYNISDLAYLSTEAEAEAAQRLAATRSRREIIRPGTSDVTIRAQTDIFHDSTLELQQTRPGRRPQHHSGDLPLPWDGADSAKDDFETATFQDLLSRPTSISLETPQDRHQDRLESATTATSRIHVHGTNIVPSQALPQPQPQPSTSRPSPLRCSSTGMSDQGGYPPSAYSGSHTPILPSDMSGGQDAYAPGTHFFHTDFLPISPQESQDYSGGSASNPHLVAIEEEKRRRNTAASARFRIKKKEREQALEKTAADMSEKVSVLETRVAQLELENKWLRGLITEKSRKMVSAESGVGGPSSEAGLGPIAKPKSRNKTSRDEDSKRSPSKRTDGVGTK